MTVTTLALLCLLIITIVVVYEFAQQQYDRVKLGQLNDRLYSECLDDNNTTYEQCQVIKNG